MHILHVYKDYAPILGGIENHIKTLAETQSRAGHRVSVLVTNPGGQPSSENMNGVEVIRLPRMATVASTPLSLGFPGAMRRIKPDITHLHFPYPIGEISQLLVGRDRPYVLTYHSDVVRQKTILRFYFPLMEKVLDHAARILPTSDRYMKSSSVLKDRQQQCTVVGLSADPIPFESAEPLYPDKGIPTVVFVGRHRYYKGIDDLIRAVAGLDVRLIIGGNGPLRSELEALTARLGLAQQVIFAGEVSDDDLPGLFASGDIFALPSNARSEAFGIVLLEAMASGLPCITTELGTGTSFVVQDEVTGLVVPPMDPPALRAALARLAADPALRRKFGDAGRKRLLEEFTPQTLYENVMAVYEDVLRMRG